MESGRVYIIPLIAAAIVALFGFSLLNGSFATAIYDDQVVPRKLLTSIANRDAMMSDVVTIAAGGTVEYDVSDYFGSITAYTAVNTASTSGFWVSEDAGALTVTGTSTDTVLITVWGRLK